MFRNLQKKKKNVALFSLIIGSARHIYTIGYVRLDLGRDYHHGCVSWFYIAWRPTQHYYIFIMLPQNQRVIMITLWLRFYESCIVFFLSRKRADVTHYVFDSIFECSPLSGDDDDLHTGRGPTTTLPTDRRTTRIIVVIIRRKIVPGTSVHKNKILL